MVERKQAKNERENKLMRSCTQEGYIVNENVSKSDARSTRAEREGFYHIQYICTTTMTAANKRCV